MESVIKYYARQPENKGTWCSSSTLYAIRKQMKEAAAKGFTWIYRSVGRRPLLEAAEVSDIIEKIALTYTNNATMVTTKAKGAHHNGTNPLAAMIQTAFDQKMKNLGAPTRKMTKSTMWDYKQRVLYFCKLSQRVQAATRRRHITQESMRNLLSTIGLFSALQTIVPPRSSLISKHDSDTVKIGCKMQMNVSLTHSLTHLLCFCDIRYLGSLM